MIGNIIVAAILLLIVLWAACRIREKAKRGGGCCPEHEEAIQKVAAADRNKRNYPYKVILKIGGMTCENCARKVENALNSLPDTWARVDIADKKATVLLKSAPEEKRLRETVAVAGYSVSEILPVK